MFNGLSYNYLNTDGTTSTCKGSDIMNNLMYIPGVYMISQLNTTNSTNNSDINALNAQVPSLYTNKPTCQIYYPYVFGGPVGASVAVSKSVGWLVYPNYAFQVFMNNNTNKYAFTDDTTGRSYIYHNISKYPQVVYCNSSMGTNNVFPGPNYKSQYGLLLNGSNINLYNTPFIRIWYRGNEMKLLMATCSTDASAGYPSGNNLCSDDINNTSRVILLI